MERAYAMPSATRKRVSDRHQNPTRAVSAASRKWGMFIALGSLLENSYMTANLKRVMDSFVCDDQSGHQWQWWIDPRLLTVLSMRPRASSR